MHSIQALSEARYLIKSLQDLVNSLYQYHPHFTDDESEAQKGK